MRMIPSVLLALPLAACGHRPGREFAAQTPAFDAAAFFAGETEGTGTLHRVLRRNKIMVVRGTGRYVDGRLLLTQRILIQDEPPTRRTWDLHRVAPGQWRGTLSDGSSPVTLVSAGNTIHIRFRTSGGFGVNQWLYLRPDGKTALNRMKITKLGARFASIDETIRHID